MCALFKLLFKAFINISYGVINPDCQLSSLLAASSILKCVCACVCVCMQKQMTLSWMRKTNASQRLIKELISSSSTDILIS